MNKISDLKVGDQVVLWNGGKIDTVTKLTFCGGANLAKSRHIHGNNVNWQETKELNNKQMKELKIEVPQGFEIDKEKSTFGKIVFKEIESKLPMSVEEIPNRNWFIGGDGIVYSTNGIGAKDKNQLSTKERAEAFLALMQLVELRDAWNGDWKADWSYGNLHKKYVIEVLNNYINSKYYQNYYKVLHFKSEQLRDQFAEQFKDLIEQAKELL